MATRSEDPNSEEQMIDGLNDGFSFIFTAQLSSASTNVAAQVEALDRGS